jgi:hypothetical protein
VIEVVEKRVVGTVVSVAFGPALKGGIDTVTGDVHQVPYPGRETVVITLTLDVTDNGRELGANGFVIRAGEHLSVTGPGWAGQGYIVGVDRDGGAK